MPCHLPRSVKEAPKIGYAPEFRVVEVKGNEG